MISEVHPKTTLTLFLVCYVFPNSWQIIVGDKWLPFYLFVHYL